VFPRQLGKFQLLGDQTQLNDRPRSWRNGASLLPNCTAIYEKQDDLLARHVARSLLLQLLHPASTFNALKRETLLNAP